MMAGCRKTGLVVAVWFGAAVGLCSGVAADEFEITIENLSPNVLTPVVLITHDNGFDLFDTGQAASGALERLAEDGDPSQVITLATGSVGTTVSDVATVSPGVPIGPGGSASVTIQADTAHPLLSFASMLAVSNDAFIGVATGDGAIDLFPGGAAFNGVVVVTDSDVWDAGTEVNDELSTSVPGLGAGVDAGDVEGGVITIPHAGIGGLDDIPSSRNWVGGDVARITITPEPTSAALMGLGAIGSLMMRRRRRRA